MVGGSSPRVRGKRGHGSHGIRAGGLIPACAGKTGWLRGRNCDLGAHPRVCGENLLSIRFQVLHPGSSPRVRGKHIRAESARRGLGLIPACAGKTTWLAPSATPSQAHPRVCGENRPLASKNLSYAGSSPRVRGKPAFDFDRSSSEGLIPACAGKTKQPKPSRNPPTAHPRVCGENWIVSVCFSSPPGSSPRVRGKH